jgi:eukaryotic-like serine/threonine-protein kinase
MYPQVFGKYVLERELARGGMARVVLATLRGAGGFEKKLVVKQIREELACDDDFVRRFVEEAKTTVALAHPNIVPVYELGVELGTYFLAMEFVEGASLAELLRAAPKDRKPLSPEEGAYVGVEVCRALDYAHRRMNVVHRDVTPRNVMVDEEGGVKVIDFGISAPVATTPSGAGVFGSPGHMPPEQVAGKELAPAADVFAVAVLLMELWSGKAPFRRHTNEAIDEAMRAPHPKPSDADVRLLPLDEVIGAAMSLDPKKRPQQAEELGRALRKFLSGMDLGDVAKQLGARVKTLRASPPPPSSDKKPALQRPPSRPQAVDMGTKTFAAREEVLPTSDGAGTRKLASAPPPKPGKEIETVATRPIESGPREAETAPASARRSNVTWFALAGAAAAAVAAFYLGRGVSPTTTPTTSPTASAAATSSVTSTATATTSATATTTASSTAIPNPRSSLTPTPTPSPPPPNGPTPTASVAADKATLTLLGDGTTVTVDGVPRGSAPTKASVDPGTHAINFTFPATGESKGESITVKSGDKATLRADFTGATPTIRVQR